ncbi:methyltransferase [Delftia acidovorans]|uniref:Methyltransferase n=1 Tax=Delftia acidovorans TaxID=80866 RepID=A0AAJ2R697_DELAC|nr:methyltransferase [Delftia acidovorans]MDX4955912.1 methyltransferase [Delftia acidovorans]
MQVSNDVLAVLSAAQANENQVQLVGQLDRALYARVNKVLEAAGGKWDRKAKAHVFSAPAADRLDQIILSGSVEVPKDEFNFFPSPPAVVERLMRLAGIKAGMRVLEPSAGRGAIAVACIDAGAAVDCFELMEANHNVLAADDRLDKVVFGDFLKAEPEPVYDRVVMNPPFLKQADIKHVMHAHQFLKPGGRLVSVMSAGVTFRTDARTTAFNAFVQERGGQVEELPENSFKASGTGVHTVIVTIPA